MKRSGMKATLPSTSLKRSRSATTFALRWMEEEHRRAIGRRLWDLRENSPETNRSIGDAVGVSERTVAEWVAGRQGITYDHAQEVARFFDVDLDWFWRGKEKAPTPDLLADLSPVGEQLQDQLDRIERAILELRSDVADLGVELDAHNAPAPPRRPPKPAAGR